MSKNGGGGICRMLNTLAGLALLGAGGFMIWHFMGRPSTKDVKSAWENFGGFGDFSDVLGNITDINLGDYYDSDPFVADNSTKAWRNDGAGLELEIVNALDDTWQDEFAQAVSDWDSGSPDTLTLTVTRGEVDYSCKEQEGVLKVCSGNFGDSGWLGINDLLFIESTGEVLSSVAKMNEFYLRNADADKRQYTMCHEMGHGFGLPHTDEVFTNPSLGNCMDYTNRPEENLHPDESNYNRLASIYGQVAGRRRRLGRRPQRNRRSGHLLTEELRQEYVMAMAEIEQPSVQRALSESEMSEHGHWKLIENLSKGSLYERPLGTKLRMRAHVLHESRGMN